MTLLFRTNEWWVQNRKSARAECQKSISPNTLVSSDPLVEVISDLCNALKCGLRLYDCCYPFQWHLTALSVTFDSVNLFICKEYFFQNLPKQVKKLRSIKCCGINISPNTKAKTPEQHQKKSPNALMKRFDFVSQWNKIESECAKFEVPSSKFRGRTERVQNLAVYLSFGKTRKIKIPLKSLKNNFLTSKIAVDCFHLLLVDPLIQQPPHIHPLQTSSVKSITFCQERWIPVE